MINNKKIVEYYGLLRVLCRVMPSKFAFVVDDIKKNIKILLLGEMKKGDENRRRELENLG